MTDKTVVFSTCDSEDEARRIARELVEQRLAACVQIVPGVRSVYQWKGQVEEGAEFLLLMKTRRDLVAELARSVRKMHSYETPELVAAPVVDGLADYLAWMDRELAEKAGPDG